MKEKKTIGFDILDNVGLDTIDRIGTDMDMLDEKTKKRILEMTKKRFNDAIKGENAGIENIVTDENAEIVENVEVYNRSKIRRIMTGVVNTAAVVGLAAGSVFLVKGLNKGDIDKPVEPDMPAVSSTEPANQTQEEKARNQRIEEYIQNLYNSTGDQYSDEDFYNNLKIDYAYLDINNDSVDELFIRYDFIDSAADAKGMSINYFDGTNYVHFYDVWGTFKFDLNNRKLYELSKTYLNENVLDISTWENIEISDNTVFFTSQDKYRPIDSDDVHYSHNEEPCTKEEYENAIAEYENCVGAELNFIPYTVKRESAEKTARNQRIEEYIQELYNYYVISDEEQFYNSLEVKYAYLDINNDSVSELIIRYNLLPLAPDSVCMQFNYFDGTKYIPFEEINDTSEMAKIDLQNRRLYEIYEGHEPGYYTYVKTWENIEFSDNKDFFTVQDTYCSNMVTYEPTEYIYTHNDLTCTKEEYESAWAEYENCDSAELNFVPYNVKRTVSSAVQTQAVDTNNEETIQTTIATINKPTQEVLDKARDAALKARFDKHDKNNYVSMSYAYYDINDDSVPELLVSNEYNINWEMEIYKFNGAEFVFKTAVGYSTYVKFCTSEKLVEGCEKMSSMVHSITRYDDEFNFSTVDRVIEGYNFDENGNMYDEYRFNDQIITEEEFNSHIHECGSCEILSNDVEFLLYKANDPNYDEKLAREQLINNFDSEGVYDSINYSYIELNDDGKSELIILCDDYDTNKATFNIYHLENDSYVLKTTETNFTFKIDLDNKRIYFADDFSGTVEFMYYLTWDENCNMKFVKQAYAGDEGFEELLAEYEACEEIYLDCIPC